MNTAEYKTVEGTGKGIYREKGSRFLAFSFGISSPEEAMEIVGRLRKEYHDARHHCYAYITGSERNFWRANDDGEPSGTAGRPILGQISSYGLTDTLVIVVRYFGGTLLGTGGLINAYRSAAALALADSRIVTKSVMIHLKVRFKWHVMNSVMKIIKDCEGAVQKEHVFENECIIRLDVPVNVEPELRQRLMINEGVIVDIEP